jgi:sorbitol-specific phosphotransferase system component IIC
MGSVHKASCSCGYTNDVTIGGGRLTFLEESVFPFYCCDCGLVEVNVAKLSDQCTEATCPICGKKNITRYGIPPVSLFDLRPPPAKKFWQFWKKKWMPSHIAALRCWNLEASESGHICPSCHEMTLKFDKNSSILFD